MNIKPPLKILIQKRALKIPSQLITGVTHNKNKTLNKHKGTGITTAAISRRESNLGRRAGNH